MKRCDPPLPIYLAIVFVIMAGAAQGTLARIFDHILHRPNACRRRGRGNFDLRHVSVMHGYASTEKTAYIGNENIAAANRRHWPAVATKCGDSSIDLTFEIVGENFPPGDPVLCIEIAEISSLQPAYGSNLFLLAEIHDISPIRITHPDGGTYCADIPRPAPA